MDDFNIKNFDPKKSLFIEASAGTGKTYTIQKIVARLVGDGVPLNQILIVTYTEKAAGELRHRIREELVARANKESDAETKDRFAAAARTVDLAPIHTIHSFCQKTLRDYAFEAGQPFAMEMVDDKAVDDFIDKMIRDTWREDDAFKELVNLSGDCDATAKKLKSYFRSGVLSFFNGVGMDVIDETDPAFCSPYRFAKDYDDLMKVEEFKNEVAKITDKQTWDRRIKFVHALEIWTQGKGLYNGNDFSRNADKEAIGSVFPRLKDELTGLNKTVADKYCQRFVLLHLDEIVSAWKRYKSERGLQSYQDMIDSVRANLSNEAFLKVLREAYSYAIIDEFQDTNLRQWDIFRSVFLDSTEHRLIVVGDPKQSIYSFQGADVTVYRQATEAIGGEDAAGEGFRLGVNYRSTDGMIEACNALFEKDAMKKSLSFASSETPADVQKKPAATYDGVEVDPIQLAPQLSADDFALRAVEMICRCLERGADGKTRLQVFEKDEEKRKTEPMRNVTLRDFAVLARTRSEMDPIEKVLRERKIPHLRYKDSGLFKGRECREWIALFKALAASDFNGSNGRLLNEVLVTDFFGVPIQCVTQDDAQKGDSAARKDLLRWRSLVLKGRYEQFLEDVYATPGLIDRLGTKRRMQEYGRFRQIGDYAVRYLADHRASLNHLVLHLESLTDDSGDADAQDGNLVAKSTDSDAVQVMTIHASKGLEFPVVIAVAGFKGKKSSSNCFYLYHENDTLRMGVSASAKEKRESEENEELKRLFYVAYTRASSLLVLPQYTEWESNRIKSPKFLKEVIANIAEAVKKGDSRWTGKCSRFKPEGSAVSFEPITEKLDVNADGNKDAISDVRKKVPHAIQRKHSYSSLAHGNDDHEADAINGSAVEGKNGSEKDGVPAKDIDPHPVIFMGEKDGADVDKEETPTSKDYPRGAGIGNVLHDTLERICNGEAGLSFGLFASGNENSWVANKALRDIIHEEFKRQGLAKQGRMDDWIDASVKIIYQTLRAKLCKDGEDDGGFHLYDLKPEEARAEMEYHVNVGEENKFAAYCTGFMDLVFKRNGKYCILDWKSDGLDKCDAASVKGKVDSRYAVQRVLYPYCLIQWLKTFHAELSEAQIFDRYFGGMYYVFLRGTREDSSRGIYAQTWESYAALEAAYGNLKKIIADKAGK